MRENLFFCIPLSSVFSHAAGPWQPNFAILQILFNVSMPFLFGMETWREELSDAIYINPKVNDYVQPVLRILENL